VSDVKINAIRNMYDGFQGDRMKLDSGEIIHTWILFDDDGTVINHLDLDDIEITKAYKASTIWMEKYEYEKVG
jgi:hypothetical protein